MNMSEFEDNYMLKISHATNFNMLKLDLLYGITIIWPTQWIRSVQYTCILLNRAFLKKAECDEYSTVKLLPEK